MRTTTRTQKGRFALDRLPALERNIAQLRAMQMVLTIFHAQQLKESIISTIRVSDQFRGDGPSRCPPNCNRPVQRALDALVEDNALTPDEAAEMAKLIDYRNDIAHEIEHLNADLSRLGRDYSLGKHYNYRADARLAELRKILAERSQSKYIITLGFADLAFEPMEQALMTGIKRLDKRIERQIAERKEKIAAARLAAGFQPNDFT